MIVEVIVFIVVFTIIACWGMIAPWMAEWYMLSPTTVSDNVSITDNNVIKGLNVITSEFHVDVDDLIDDNKSHKLNGVYITRPVNKRDILVCHDGCGTMFEKINLITVLIQYGNIIMFDYRGYGKSTGTSNEMSMYKDAMNIWKFWQKQTGGREVILVGEGIGGTVASKLVHDLIIDNKKFPKMLILHTPISSFKDTICDDWFFLRDIVPKNKFDTEKYLRIVNGVIPILIIHSVDDSDISYENTMRLSSGKNVVIYEINGDRNTPKYPDDFYKFMYDFINENKIKRYLVKIEKAKPKPKQKPKDNNSVIVV